MTTIQIVSLVWLAFVFALSLRQHINLGLIMIPAAFALAEYAGIPMKQLYAAFPIQLMILVLGVMYLWNHVQESGLAEIVIRKTAGMARGRVFLLPWAMALLTALICAIGALPAAALAITTPVAIGVAKRERINPTLMGVVCIQGACVGGFSPFNPWGNLVATQAAQGNIPFAGFEFFLVQAALATAVGIVGFFCFGGMELLRRPRTIPSDDGEAAANPRTGLTAYQKASFAGLCLFIVLVLRKFDIGLTAFAVGMILQIVFRVPSKNVIAKLPWGIVLMLAGVLTYVGLLDRLGVLHAIGDLMSGMEKPALVRFGVTLLGTVIANFESSSVAVLGLVIPVAIKTMPADISPLFASMQLALLSGSITVMAASPFHIGGALILSEADSVDRTYSNLLLWVVCLAAVLPFLAFFL